MHTEVKNLKDQRLELTITLEPAELQKFLKLAEERLARQLKQPGFRQGKVPPKVAREALGAEAVLNEGFEVAIGASLADALVQEKIDALRTEKLNIITNTAEALKFSVEVLPFPTVILGDYQTLAVEHKAIVVGEEEIDNTLNFIQRSRPVKSPTGDHGVKALGANDSKPVEEVLPPLTDEFAKSLGNFANLAELRHSISEGIKLEKAKKEADRFRIALLDTISQNSKIELPDWLVEQELMHQLGHFEQSLKQRNLELSVYLSKINKTEADLKKEWRPQAEKQLRHMLILRAIAHKENLNLTDAEVDVAADKILADYFQNTQQVPDVDIEHFKRHLREDLLREKLLVFLEKANIANS